MLHLLAFRTSMAQVALSDIEDTQYSGEVASTSIERPVFVTGLPRAGTTLILEVLVNSGEFVSHTYRDMPFVLIPLTWSRFSRHFAQSDVPRERAHGDGMVVGLDSPEAFEEVVWKAFWKEHYLRDRIRPWGEVTDAEFEDFLRMHIRKILIVRRRELNRESPRPARYVSKNNLNIARVRYLSRLFPDAAVVVPFRDPLQHALSLQRQHLNFLEIHRRDHFARSYMEAIGHYDFGDNLRPVDFDGWVEARGDCDRSSLAFWLRYWLAAYSYLLRNRSESVVFVSYDDFCQSPQTGLRALSRTLGMSSETCLSDQADRFFVPRRTDPPSTQGVAGEVEAAMSLYAQLAERSIVGTPPLIS